LIRSSYFVMDLIGRKCPVRSGAWVTAIQLFEIEVKLKIK
jgi:hypothetical protein